jgi:deoxyribodipyrimidine photo-lyase
VGLLFVALFGILLLALVGSFIYSLREMDEAQHERYERFKRDLRGADHAPLSAARGFSRALAVFIIEPAWLASPECDARHVAFALDCVEDLRQQGLPVLVRCGEAVAVLQALRDEHGVTHLLSHEETGPGWTWERDKAVAAWCRAQGVPWAEFAQTGVVRRLRSRTGWAGADKPFTNRLRRRAD